MGDFKCGKLTGIPAIRYRNAWIPAKTVCDLVSESRMRLTFNAVDANGINYNNLTFNGLNFNDLNVNGLNFNGLNQNGFSFDNGFNFNGFNGFSSFNGPSFNGENAAVEELNRQSQETIDKIPPPVPPP